MEKNMSVKIGVVIPCYKVREHILGVISKIGREVSVIYVVDDACPDRSGNFVEMHCHDSRVRVLHHEQNQGVGGAVITGYQTAISEEVEIIVKIDGDGQMDPAYLIQLIAPIVANHADYTKGNRFLHADELKAMPLVRRIGNSGLSFLTKAASGYWDIFDPTNGYTAIHASLVPLLKAEKLHKRFFFESSMLIELGMLHAVIRDIYIPARYHKEVSSLSESRALLEFPPRLFISFLRRLITQYFIRDFSVFSVLFLFGWILSIFGIVFGAYHWYLSAKTGITASTGTVMIAVLPFILGSQLLIQAMIVDVQNIPSEPLQANIRLLKEIREMLRCP